MSTDPTRAPDDDDDQGSPPLPEGEDPLVERLRMLRWPAADDETRERALERFRDMINERENPEPEAAGD
jgi:hypothetical protein